jgi:hypothetical protein
MTHTGMSSADIGEDPIFQPLPCALEEFPPGELLNERLDVPKIVPPFKDRPQYLIRGKEPS